MFHHLRRDVLQIGRRHAQTNPPGSSTEKT